MFILVRLASDDGQCITYALNALCCQLRRPPLGELELPQVAA